MRKKTRQSSSHNYPTSRQSTKGMSKYEIYEKWRERLKESGYSLADKLTESEFNKLYEKGKKDKAKNITRTIARFGINVTKSGMKKIMTDLMTGRNMTLAEYYDPTTGELNLQGLSRKELYDIFKQRAIEDHNWTRDPNKPEKWEKVFFRKGGLY